MWMGVDLLTLIRVEKRNKKVINDDNINDVINKINYLINNKNDFRISENQKLDLIIILPYLDIDGSYSSVFNTLLKTLKTKIINLGGIMLTTQLFQINILDIVVNTLVL